VAAPGAPPVGGGVDGGGACMVACGMRWHRIALLVVVGSVAGLAWNALSGRGIALTANVYLAGGVKTITAAEAKQRLDKGAVLFLDARPRMIWEFSHIPGALPLPEDEMDSAFAELQPRLRGRYDIVVYCSGFGCEASHIVARHLMDEGIPAVVLDGGIPAWEDAGYPLREGDKP
jgi:rhodanese-related sulfurtransferase